MQVSDLKRSFCLGAVGQVGGVVGGFISVVIISIVSTRNFFDSPIRIAVFITACGLIGGVAAFSASISLVISPRLLFSIPLALAASTGLCILLKIILSPAGDDSPIGKLFWLVSAVFTLCQVVIGSGARRRHGDQKENAGVGRKSRRPPLGRRLARAVGAGAATSLVILVVLLAVFAEVPIADAFEIDGLGVLLYALLGFTLGCIMSLVELYCTGASRRVESLPTR